MRDRMLKGSDLDKYRRDQLAELRARGVDARDITPMHPGGEVETFRQLRGEIGATRDQSQEQIARSTAETFAGYRDVRKP